MTAETAGSSATNWGGWRARWAAAGAAVAVAVGGLATSGTTPAADAITTSGERAVFTSITPCRLADTRPEAAFNVGTRSTPLGPGETHTFTARGAQGQCSAADLPDDAVAVALNVTVPTATADGFLTIWPDGPRPGSSSLNPSPSEPPTPNGVATRTSSTGTFEVYNENGFTHVIIDVIGIYTDHNHDDRYYTEAEIDDINTDLEQDLEALATSQKEIQLPITGAVLAGGATYAGAAGNRGIIIPDNVSNEFAWSFVVPRNYTSGDISVTILWTVLSSSCDVDVNGSGSFRLRPGVATEGSFAIDPGVSPSPGDGIGASTTFTLDEDLVSFQPGDAINISFNRGALADTCGGFLIVSGAIASYD